MEGSVCLLKEVSAGIYASSSCSSSEGSSEGSSVSGSEGSSAGLDEKSDSDTGAGDSGSFTSPDDVLKEKSDAGAEEDG